MFITQVQPCSFCFTFCGLRLGACSDFDSLGNFAQGAHLLCSLMPTSLYKTCAGCGLVGHIAGSKPSRRPVGASSHFSPGMVALPLYLQLTHAFDPHHRLASLWFQPCTCRNNWLLTVMACSVYVQIAASITTLVSWVHRCGCLSILPATVYSNVFDLWQEYAQHWTAR